MMAVAITGTVSAQGYKTSIGLGVDFGDGATFAGPSVKHFFTAKGAGQFDLLFGNNSTMVTGLYQYHGAIANAGGLKYYLGLGPSLVFPKGGDVIFGIRPNAGLDFRIPNAPLALNFDWRPSFWIWDGNSDFAGGRFGFGARFVLGRQ